MENENANANANQLLPEVDSLPDGFVESATEPAILLTPKTPTFEQENEVPPHSPLSPVDYKHTLSELDPHVVLVEKLRTFPVPLSDSNESSSSNAVVGVSEDDASVGNKPSTGGCSGVQTTILKEKSTPESADILKSKKLETSEVKRKNPKRGFKSEKEFLQFTLSYQQVIAERDSAVAVRDKLESLCRELQRQNKLLMDECKRVSTEGQDMRLDLSTRFHDAIKDVSHKLEEQKDECLAQLKDNDMLRNKLKHLSDQYAVSEQQFTQKLKQKTLELQLADLKVQQHEEKLTQEQSQTKLYAEQVLQLLATEKTLRLQLSADGEKFQQFQEALIKSNEVFETFKQEIEKMAKSTKELKKENAFLKGKCERSDVTLIELVDEREQWKKQLEKMRNQKEKLESLCRSLQAERKQNSLDTNSGTTLPSKTEKVPFETGRCSL